MNMTHEQLISIAKAFGYPNRGAQTKLSKASGISQPALSLVFNGARITNKMAQKLISAHDSVANGDNSIIQNQGITNAVKANKSFVDPDENLSDEEIIADISNRFAIFDECVKQVVYGSRHGTLISGPAGCGKSHTVEANRENAIGDRYESITGGISAIGLYKKLYACKDDGVLVFDDCDEVFSDETKLNLLKGALDTKNERIICWMKQSPTLKEENIPNSFDFQGRILFLTNIDFDREIERGGKMAPHFKALMSRCGYMNLALHSKRRRMLRIVQVCKEADLLGSQGITNPRDQQEILDFIQENSKRFRELSLRLVVQIANYYKAMPKRWKVHSKALQMKPFR